MQELVHDPLRRQRYRFTRDGGCLVAEVWADPGGDVPEHLHPVLEERFEVLSGSVRFRVAGEDRAAAAGDRLTVPPGAWHAFENVGDHEAHLRVTVEPAGRIEQFLTEAAALARAGRYTRRGIPRGPRAALEVADFVERYSDETVMRWPPPAVQRVTLAPLARLQRRRATRGER
jgi:quercetin dioxygenase-like cupin family protein